MSVLFDINSVVLFTSNSLKMSALFDVWKSVWYWLGVAMFDMKSETCFLLLVVIVWKCEYFFFAKCFVTICFRFSCMYFLTIRMALIKRQSDLYLIFLKLFSATDLRLKRAGQINGLVALVHSDWYH